MTSSVECLLCKPLPNCTEEVNSQDHLSLISSSKNSHFKGLEGQIESLRRENNDLQGLATELRIMNDKLLQREELLEQHEAKQKRPDREGSPESFEEKQEMTGPDLRVSTGIQTEETLQQMIQDKGQLIYEKNELSRKLSEAEKDIQKLEDQRI